MDEGYIYVHFPSLNTLEHNIRLWGEHRNITVQGGATVQAQASKGLEEMAEMFNTLSVMNRTLANIEDLEWKNKHHADMTGGMSDHEIESELADEKCTLNDLKKVLKDDIGDVTVCMIQAARLAGTDLTECLEQSWDDIKDRKGTMVNGKFVKEE